MANKGAGDRSMILGAAAACTLLAQPVAAQTAGLQHAVAPGSLDHVLHAIGAEGGVQLLFDPAMVAGHRAEAIARGTPVLDALDAALTGTGLRARSVGPGVIVVERLATFERAAAIPDSDIVVTALRRPTLLRQTGMSLTVVSGTAINERRTRDVRGLSRLAPELNVINTGPLQQRLSVRGVVGTGESTVGIYFGDAPVSAPSGTGFDAGAITPHVDLIDVDRVELLRGPQGTLYGAGSMGGTLRTIFNAADPGGATADTNVELGITAHGAPSMAAEATVNLPLISDRLAVRGVVGRRRTGGVIDNVTLGVDDTDRVVRESERLLATWIPGDSVRVEATWLSQRNRIDDAGVTDGAAPRLTTLAPVRAPNRERLSLLTATLNWAPGAIRLTATASRYVWRIAKQIDYTRVLAAQRDSTAACTRFSVAAGSSGCSEAQLAAYRSWLDTRLPGALYQPMIVKGTSGELRLSSVGGGPSGWTAGLFLEHRTDAVSSYAVRADPDSGKIVQPLDVTGLRLIDTSLDQQALFAEYRRSITSRLALTLGGRVYRYHRTARGSTPVPNIITGTGAITSGAFRTTETGGNAKAELAWTHSNGLMIYALAAEGFRPGGVNITPELDQRRRSYRADHLWSYEVGVRTPSLAGPLTAELAAYHIDWQNTIFAANSANGAFIYNTNLSSVAIDGGEFRLLWNGPRLRATATAALVDARLTADTLLGTGEGVGRRGDRLPNVPRVSYTLLWDWRLGSGIEPAAWTIGGAVSGNGPVRSTFNRQSAFYERTPGRVLADAYLLYRSGQWSLRVGVENLFDALAPSRTSSSMFGLRQGYPARPRTATLSIGKRIP
ncbi:TonB-dependent receptor domain-containing protein [Sphingomonas sp. IC4-52]|uniref:TonB-dependent receptor domain-containing protein n=1 Tax=Sphingomonas sp. IC4-52 TaxID=2887202 RepID=UPI001D10BE46|nr:TonB-dependent receptor [Sphingomonas sp. IC4-52]MCC2981006.1 TonB-dependent receptor [Sphingomonas sp. IC4-52]